MGRASVQRAIACVQELNYASNCFSRQMCAAISSQQCAVPRPLTRCVLGLSRDAPAGPNRGLLSIDVRPLSRSLSHSSRSGMPTVFVLMGSVLLMSMGQGSCTAAEDSSCSSTMHASFSPSTL